MLDSFLIWIISSVTALVALTIIRAMILHRRIRVSDLEWKAVVLISLLIGGLITFLFSQFWGHEIIVPSALDDRGAVPVSAVPR